MTSTVYIPMYLILADMYVRMYTHTVQSYVRIHRPHHQLQYIDNVVAVHIHVQLFSMYLCVHAPEHSKYEHVV